MSNGFNDVVGNVPIIGGTVPTLIYGAASNRELMTIFNNDASAAVYIGGAAVAATTGYPIPAGGEHQWLGPGAVYGICASGTIDVRYHHVA